MPMHIGTPELTSADGEVMWSVSVTGLPGTPDRLWFKLPQRHAGLITMRADPAIIGLLVPAMHSALPIAVDGPVTDELAHNLRHGYQQVLNHVIGGLSPVSIETPQTVMAGESAAGVGTGFSGGVDSYAVVVDHHFSTTPLHLRLTHLTYFNVGSHGRGVQGRDLFRVRFGRLIPVAEKLGLPFVSVDSNLDDFYTFGGFQQTNGPRNISAASLLQGGIGRYYFASSFSYAHIGVRRSEDTAFSDPISLPLLTTGQFRPIPHGDEYTRVAKTLLVASAPITHTTLDVCVQPLPNGGNCSSCTKCLRTELTLEIAGRLEEFGEVFDLEVYRQKRAPYLREIAVSKGEFAGEVRDFARDSAFPLSKVPTPVLRGIFAVRRKSLSWKHASRSLLRPIFLPLRDWFKGAAADPHDA